MNSRNLFGKIALAFILQLVFISSIGFAAKGKSALVVIDMQAIFVTRGGNDNDPENVAKLKKLIEEQKAAINEAKAAKIPIIFIEYDGYGETNEELKAAAGKYKPVKVFKKDTDGMFSSYNTGRKELKKYLEKNDIGTLIITGANGGACVNSSIHGALEDNYSVIAFSRGIADFNYKEFIYPYNYTDIKPNCKDCTFEEVAEVAEVNASLEGERYANRSNAPKGNNTNKSAETNINSGESK